MAELSRFYGIIISIYSELYVRHHLPHFHARYAEYSAVVAITDGTIIEGELPTKAKKLLDAWFVIHQEELIKCWEQVAKGENPGKIDPLI